MCFPKSLRNFEFFGFCFPKKAPTVPRRDPSTFPRSEATELETNVKRKSSTNQAITNLPNYYIDSNAGTPRVSQRNGNDSNEPPPYLNPEKPIERSWSIESIESNPWAIIGANGMPENYTGQTCE